MPRPSDRKYYTAARIREIYGERANGILSRLAPPERRVGGEYAWIGDEVHEAAVEPVSGFSHVSALQTRQAELKSQRDALWPDESARRRWTNHNKMLISGGVVTREGQILRPELADRIWWEHA